MRDDAPGTCSNGAPGTQDGDGDFCCSTECVVPEGPPPVRGNQTRVYVSGEKGDEGYVGPCQSQNKKRARVCPPPPPLLQHG